MLRRERSAVCSQPGPSERQDKDAPLESERLGCALQKVHPQLGQDSARASPLGLGLGGSPKKIQHPDSASLHRNWVKVCLLLQQKSVLSNGCLEALWYAASLSHYKGSWDFKAMSVSTHRERLYHKQDCFFFSPNITDVQIFALKAPACWSPDLTQPRWKECLKLGLLSDYSLCLFCPPSLIFFIFSVSKSPRAYLFIWY